LRDDGATPLFHTASKHIICEGKQPLLYVPGISLRSATPRPLATPGAIPTALFRVVGVVRIAIIRIVDRYPLTGLAVGGGVTPVG